MKKATVLVIGGSQFQLGPGAIRYDTRSYFNVRSKVDVSQLNVPHGTKKVGKK